MLLSLLPDFLSGVRLIVRARFFAVAAWCSLLIFLAVLLSAQFSGRQPATVSLDVGLSLIRLLLPLVIVLMAQELLSREFDRRYFLSSLAYPRARYVMLLGRFIALVAMGGGLLLALALGLRVVVQVIGQGYAQSTPVELGAAYWAAIAAVGVDFLVLTALAVFLAVVSSTPSFLLIGTIGFMLVARSFSSIVALLARESWVVEGAETYRSGLSAIGYLLPDLGALDLRMLALYGKWEFLPADWPWLLLSCLLYAAAFLALAVWALQRKRFV